MSLRPESIFVDGSAYANPFVAIEKLGAEWAEAGMDPDDIVEAAVALGGEPRGMNGNPYGNLLSYAADTCLLRFRSLDVDQLLSQRNQTTEELEGEA